MNWLEGLSVALTEDCHTTKESKLIRLKKQKEQQRSNWKIKYNLRNELPLGNVVL